MTNDITLVSVTDITTTGDVSTVTTYNAGTYNLAETVTGIQGKAITLATGRLRYDAPYWSFEDAAYEPTIGSGTTSQYWRGDKTWQALTTGVVAELTNLYFTDARARLAISATSPISYDNSTGIISHLATDGNLHVPATSTTNDGKVLTAGASAGSLSWVTITPTLVGAEPAITPGTSSQVWLGNKTWAQVTDTQVASGAAIAWTKISKSGAVATDVGALAITLKGAVNGVAELDSNGKVPTSQLPAYVDDVIEVANYAALPGTGENGKIYITLDTNLTYRWSGTAYVEISASLALGITSSTAYRGDYGNTAYLHSQIINANPHETTFAQLLAKPTTLAGYGITDGPFLALAGGMMDSGASIFGVARPGDGGRHVRHSGSGASIAGINTGTNNVLINRHVYSGFDGFVATNTEFFGITQDHEYGAGAQLSIISGTATGKISYFVGTPTVQVNGYYQAPKVGEWVATGLSGAGGMQTVWTKDSVPNTSANTNYIQTPIAVQRSSTSGTTAVAGIGFHNNGVNAAMLYYDPTAASDFKYNRHTGAIVTLWDTGNLTNLNQLTNGPGYVTGGPYLLLAAGAIHGEGAYTNANATLAVGDAQYGMSAVGSVLNLHYPTGGSVQLRASGGYAGTVATREWSDTRYQPLENQRLSTTDVVQFDSLLADGIFSTGAIVFPTIGANGFVRTDASGVLSSSQLIAGDIPALNYLPLAGGMMNSGASIFGIARSSDGGRHVHYSGSGTALAGINTGTSNALINRYFHSGFDGFVVSSNEFYGLTQDHEYGGPGAQVSLVAGNTNATIAFFAGAPTIQGNGYYQAPKVGYFNSTGLIVAGTLYAGGAVTSNGLLTSNSGISAAGAIYGATTITSNGLLTANSGASIAGAFYTNGTNTLAGLSTGFVRSNSSGLLSSSALVAGDIPTLAYLPLAAGSGSPLTGVLYGTGLNFTSTANASITIAQNVAGAFTHPLRAFNAGMTVGDQYNFDFGQADSNYNAGNFGFRYNGASSTSNYVTLGLFGANNLLTITGAGVATFSGLGTGFVRSTSGTLSSSPLVAGDVPTLNQNTTGSAATLTTTRSIATTGDATWSVNFNGSADVSSAITIAAGSVTLAKMANLAANSIIGNNTGSAATPIALTVGQVQTMLGVGGGPFLPVNNPTFTGTLTGPIATIGGGIIRGNVTYSTQGCIYGDNVGTLTTTNYSILWTTDGASSVLNGSTSSILSVGGNAKIWAQSGGVTLYNTLTLNGYLTAGFVKTNSSGVVAIDTTVYVNKAGDTGLGSLSGTAGSQTIWTKDITPNASSNTNYAQTPIVVNRASTSSGDTTTVAGIGFHNQGINAAMLYYKSNSDVFAYNRHTGDIVTIWDTSNLTNLNQLTNGPNYITASALAPYLLIANPAFTGTLTGPTATLTGTISTTQGPTANGNIIAGHAAMGTWVPSNQFAWFGYTGLNDNPDGYSGYGQDLYGSIFLAAPNGEQIDLIHNSTTVLTIDSAGATFSDAATFNDTLTATTSTVGGMTQVASVFFVANVNYPSSTVPEMAANTWCYLICDDSGGTNRQWYTSNSQSVRIRGGGTWNITSAGGNAINDDATLHVNHTTIMLIGPAYSGDTVCTIIL